MRDMKLRDKKMQNNLAGAENAAHENARMAKYEKPRMHKYSGQCIQSNGARPYSKVSQECEQHVPEQNSEPIGFF